VGKEGRKGGTIFSDQGKSRWKIVAYGEKRVCQHCKEEGKPEGKKIGALCGGESMPLASSKVAFGKLSKRGGSLDEVGRATEKGNTNE